MYCNSEFSSARAAVESACVIPQWSKFAVHRLATPGNNSNRSGRSSQETNDCVFDDAVEVVLEEKKTFD